MVMTSALQQISRIRDRNPNRRTKTSTDSYQYPDTGDWAPRRAPAAPFLFDDTAAKFPGREDDNNATTVDLPSRGVRLLLKAKGFHLAVRGHRETSGFRYISAQPKRQAGHGASDDRNLPTGPCTWAVLKRGLDLFETKQTNLCAPSDRVASFGRDAVVQNPVGTDTLMLSWSSLTVVFVLSELRSSKESPRVSISSQHIMPTTPRLTHSLQ